MFNTETQEFIAQHADDDVRRLALKKAPQNVDLPAALQQIEGWQTARRKLPQWAAKPGLWYPPRLSMEQCSSQQTALYKQRLVQRLCPQAASGRFADLTGGFGIDFSYLAPLFKEAIYVERQTRLCHIARHNFGELGLHHARVCEGDAARFVADKAEGAFACLFLDPARRDGLGRKTVAIDDCEPNLAELQERLRSRAAVTVVKLSPMLDVHRALQQIQGVSEVHVVSADNECKELLLVMRGAAPGDGEAATFHCVNLTAAGESHVSFTQREEQECPIAYANRPAAYLYEPNASLLKGGGHRCAAARLRLSKLHPNSHLYTGDELHRDFPGRVFAVEEAGGFGKGEAKRLLGGIAKANLTVRNFPTTVEQLRKRLHLAEGGDCYLFATTTADEGHWLVRCRKV